MQIKSTKVEFGLRNPFLFNVRFSVREMEPVPFCDLLAMWRYKVAVKARDWLNERITRITNTGVVLRMTTADDYRRMKEFREDKAHRLIFPRIMYHLHQPSKVVRSEKDAAALLREGYDFRPVFSEPDVAPTQIATLQSALRTANHNWNEIDTRLMESRSTVWELTKETTKLKRELREANERLASVPEVAACQ